MPAFGPNDFSFNEGTYLFEDDMNQHMVLSLSKTEFGKQWIISAGGRDTKQTFCKDDNCQAYDFYDLDCYKGIEAGENINYYYCMALFYRKLITGDGYIHPEEILDMNFFVDSRKVSDGNLFGKYVMSNYVPKAAVGVTGVKHQLVEDYLKEANSKK